MLLYDKKCSRLSYWRESLGDRIPCSTFSCALPCTNLVSLFFLPQAFLFYLWLCVVSHFQVLREVDKLGLMHRLDDVR